MDRTLFDAEHEAFRKTFKTFVERDIKPHQQKWREQGQVDREVWRKAGAQGFLCPWLEEKWGGSGGDFLHSVIIMEELAHAYESGFAMGLHSDIIAPYIHAFGTDEQRQKWLPGCASGEIVTALAMTEPGTGSDLAAIATTAIRDGDHYLLSGEKWHVTSFNLADTVIVQARLGNGPNAGAMSLFFCPTQAAGLRIVRSPAYAHTYNHHHPVIAFEHVRVPVTDRIGAEGNGMTFTNAWFRRERLMIAARCCGAAGRLIETGLDFARNRLVSGRPIADYQLIQAMLADSAAELHAARLVTREAAAAHDCGLDLKTLHARCSLAKLNASEMAWRVADRIVQIFGGRGYMRENVAERYLRELRVDRIWEGTSEIQRLIIARALLKRGLDGVIG